MSVADTAPTVTGMELHVWRYIIVLLAAANSLDAGRRVVMENSSAVDIAPMEGAMVGNAGSISQKFTVEQKHLVQ